jgi:hypothetical protein
MVKSSTALTPSFLIPSSLIPSSLIPSFLIPSLSRDEGQSVTEASENWLKSFSCHRGGGEDTPITPMIRPEFYRD